jgi:hypothetical protein
MTLVGPMVSSLVCVSSKSERRAAREVVADYHGAQLGALVARVGEAVDRYRAGELDAFEVDRAFFQYSRAAKELWKFCNYLQVEVAAAMIIEQPPHDWWDRELRKSGDVARLNGLRYGSQHCWRWRSRARSGTSAMWIACRA